MAEKHPKTKLTKSKKNKTNNCMTDDSDDQLQYPAFDLGNQQDSDFDLDVPPTSGQEYLRRVRIETRHVPEIVVAKISPKYVKSQTVKYKETADISHAPPGFAPSIDWQHLQVSNFSTLRLNFSRQKQEIFKSGFKKRELPKATNYEGWCNICHGRQTADKSNFGQGSPPLLNIILSMDQGRVQYVLEYCVNWLESFGFSTFLGTWFYALLTAIEKPLIPEICAVLRNLARECARQRSFIESPEDQNLRELNLMICLVARYFDQWDLADPA